MTVPLRVPTKTATSLAYTAGKRAAETLQIMDIQWLINQHKTSTKVLSNFLTNHPFNHFLRPKRYTTMPIPTVKSLSNMSDCSTDGTVSTDMDYSSHETRKVSFGSILIREYERIVGDHPETRIGVPMSIGWGYHVHEPVEIDTYEANRKPKMLLRMSSITRKNILHKVFGIPEEELRAAEKEIQKIKKSREHSIKQSKVSAITESALKGVRRKIKRALSVKHLYKGFSAAATGGMMMPMAA